MKITIIPLAGRGKRFLDEGYTLPKPLLPIDGVPMIIAAARALPATDKYIFLCLREHIEKYRIDTLLQKHFAHSQIIPVDSLTAGQASTCLLAKPYVDDTDQITIGACDNSMIYAQSKFEKLIADAKTDAVIWTFRNNPHVLRNPHHWGWVQMEGKKVKKVSVKVPLSDTPLHDFAVIGCFTFKKAAYFFDNALEMVRKKRTIANEFYNDECMNVLIEKGLQVRNFEVETYIGWGTPADYKTYEYWCNFHKKKK